MKKKLQFLFFSILLSVPFAQAQKIDVWDFGGAILDVNLYNNNLTVSDINLWYSVAAGTNKTNLPNSTVLTLTSGILTLKTGGSDRLYSTNTEITRYGTGGLGTTDTNYTARYYCNSNATATTRFFTLTLNVDDEVTIVSSAESVGNSLSVVNTTTGAQTEAIPLVKSGTAVTLAKFQAKQAGDFKISCLSGKGNYYRILRKPATYTTISGTVDETAAPGIKGYSVVFTNSAGKVWTASVTFGSYNVILPAGDTYKMSLLNANGYIISNGDSVNVLDSTTITNIAIKKIDLCTVSGTIRGLGINISKVSLVYTPEVSTNKIFVPTPVIYRTNSLYTVELNPKTKYTVSAIGVNDYEIAANTITVTGTTTADMTFTTKPIYPVTITTNGLDTTQINSLTLIFTNLNESGYVYTFAPGAAINLRNGTYAIAYSGLNSSILALTSNLKVTDAAVSKILDFVAPAPTITLPYEAILYVGTDKTYKTINSALAVVKRMTRNSTDRVTILIDPGNYEEMIDITQANITLKNAAVTPNINLLNKGVDIAAGAVRITSYYGIGYNYYSMKSNQKWDADVLRVNKENGYQPYKNVSGTTNNSYWNATLIISENGFTAEDIIIENSYNQYISLKESQDVVELATGNKGIRPTAYGSTAVQNKSFVERAAAIAVKNNIDKVVLNKCRVVGRQDSFYGGTGARVVVYKGAAMGAVDYIFGGMDAVFYQTDLVINTSDVGSDLSYLTAADQTTGRGCLMYECKVTTAVPGTETASIYRSKPGYFGRPWAANTSEVVFYNTIIETSDYPGYEGQSLILPLGWSNTLSGESAKMYEYRTIEKSGGDNSASRAAWATKLVVPTLKDGTAITTFNFTKGSDNWDPLPQLVSNENLEVKGYTPSSAVNVFGYKNRIVVSNVTSETSVVVYSISGARMKTFKTNQDVDFEFQNGFWIVAIKAADGQKSVKIITH